MRILCPHCKSPVEIADVSFRGELSCSACGSGFKLSDSSTAGWDAATGQTLDRFELLGTVGHGAFGTVYKARDPQLDRIVAVKVPRRDNVGPAEQDRDRFVREARAAAQLRHPGIVTVHEVGVAAGVPYLVSDFVDGVTLADRLTAGRPPVREAAEVVAAVADALHHAHAEGVVHRDVKPSNIMLRPDGTPVVMDFGLAKRDAGEITMTADGQVLGTPAYMSPEQARGEGHTVDARGDVYSLGVVLYQLLTGELPFRGNTRMLLHQVLHDDPKPPRALNDRLPRDLDTICLKALAKDPGRRYPTAAELAADLRRWLAGEPIRARPVGRIERGLRWAKRKPAAAAAGVLGVLAVAAAAAAGVAFVTRGEVETAYRGEVKAREDAETARKGEAEQRQAAEDALGRAVASAAETEKQRAAAVAAQESAEKAAGERQAAVERADRTAYRHRILLADLARKEFQAVRTGVLLDGCGASDRDFEWRHLYAVNQGELVSFQPHGVAGGSRCFAFGPTGRRMLVATGFGTSLWDVAGGPQTMVKTALESPTAAAFSPDGRFVVTGSVKGAVRLFDAATGELVRTFDPAGGPVNRLLYAADGACVAAVLSLQVPKQAALVVWDPATGRVRYRVEDVRHAPDGSVPAFGPDGRRIVYGHGDATRLCDAATNRPLAVAPVALAQWFGNVTAGVSGDLKWVAAEAGGAVRVTSLETGAVLRTIRPAEPPRFVSLSPDGGRLAVKTARTLTVWDLRTGRLLFTPPASRENDTSGSHDFRFAPDGRRFAYTASADTVCVCDAADGGRPVYLRHRSAQHPPTPAFAPDGRTVALGSHDLGFQLWDATSPAAVRPLPGWPVGERPRELVVTTDGRMLSTDAGVVTVRDPATGRPLATRPRPTPDRTPDAIARGGARVSTACPDGATRVWELDTGKVLATLSADDGFVRGWTGVLSPDGRWLVFFDTKQHVRVWDVDAGKEAWASGSKSFPIDFGTGFLVTPDGRAVVEQRTAAEFAVRDIATGRVLRTFHSDRGLTGGTPDSDPAPQLLVLPGLLPTAPIRVFDTATGRGLCTLKGLTGSVVTAVPSPDGTRVLTAGYDDQPRLWDVASGDEVLRLDLPPAQVRFGRHPFTPDGTRILGIGLDGLVYAWDAPADLTAWRAGRRKGFADGAADWHYREMVEATRAKDYYAVEFHADRALVARPDLPLALFMRGAVRIETGRAAEGKPDIDRALAAGVPIPMTPAKLGMIRAELGEWDAARAEYARAAALPTATPQERERHALTALMAGSPADYAAACAAARKTAAAGTADAKNSAAWAHTFAPLPAADVAAAVALAEAAVKADPARWTYRGTLGALLVRAGRHADAVEHLDEALRLQDEDVSPYTTLHLAMAAHRLGRRVDAEQWLLRSTKALERRPPTGWFDRTLLARLRAEVTALLAAP